MAEDVTAWMDAARQGDRQAFGRLYHRYHETVFRFARSRVFNWQTAEDITAETFTRALKNIDRFTWQDRDPGAWFVTIARNLIADRLKSRAYQREILTGDYFGAERDGRVAHAPDAADEVVDDEDERDQQQRVHRLRMAILRLPTADQREVMLHHHVNGLPIKQVAVLMHREPGAVKALCWRATNHIRRALVAS